MPRIERQAWRSGDAVDIIRGAVVVGRAQGSHSDGGRFDGIMIDPGDGKLYVLYWVKGNFHVEEVPALGTPFRCGCGREGTTGVDGPFYAKEGLDRDTRESGVWCVHCRTPTTT